MLPVPADPAAPPSHEAVQPERAVQGRAPGAAAEGRLRRLHLQLLPEIQVRPRAPHRGSRWDGAGTGTSPAGGLTAAPVRTEHPQGIASPGGVGLRPPGVRLQLPPTCGGGQGLPAAAPGAFPSPLPRFCWARLVLGAVLQRGDPKNTPVAECVRGRREWGPPGTAAGAASPWALGQPAAVGINRIYLPVPVARADLFLLVCGFWPLFYCGVKKKKKIKEKKQTKKGVMQKSAWHGSSLGQFPDLAQLGSSTRVSRQGWRGRGGGEGPGLPGAPPPAAGSVCLQRAGVHDLHQPADRGALAAGQPGFRQGAR